MTDLETQVRAALDQLAATVTHDADCSGVQPSCAVCGGLGEGVGGMRCPGCDGTGRAECCDREHRLLAAWSQATARFGERMFRSGRSRDVPSWDEACNFGVAALRETV